ncbi:hypothetical protein PPERSA_02376 [Pseudocohnilembus persalinus]|uniref:ABL domain-containing protein n=1 Tax=Pseudocohnilembus persalinus TaxID=266149 RepID=A0A0V0QUA0_PSEPJ|nr:hypothetical protein PPERSA_02376 [Pseudocohnilembus persalinus]|eukprot:KRX05844.1 hypothetical protein PPERSA_02376 [Pseudocohnilembus persalinus]
MMKNLIDYQLQSENNQFVLNIQWKDQENTKKIIDLDSIFHLIQDIQNQKNIEIIQKNQLEQLQNYVNQQQETQLSERDSKDNIEDYIYLEDHLRKIVQNLFEIKNIENDQVFAEFLGYQGLKQSFQNKQNENDQNNYIYQNTLKTIEKITQITQKFEGHYNFIVLKRPGFWGHSETPLIIEQNLYLYIVKPADHKSFKIPIISKNLQIQWLDQIKNGFYGIELTYLKKGKFQKIQLGTDDQQKVKNWYDNLEKALENNQNKTEEQLQQIENQLKENFIKPADSLINQELSEIFKNETKILDEEIQIQKENYENQQALNIYKYLQNQEISKEQAKQIENLILDKQQHILNCIQNYHNQEIGIKSKQDQISIYQQNNQQSETEVDDNTDSKNSKKQNKNKKQQKKLWFNKDYSVVEKSKGTNNGLHFINKDFLKVQDSIYSTMIKRFGKVLFSGQPIFSISMPAVMFQAETMLERAAYTFGHNHYLNYAANTNNSVESIKFMTCFYQSSFIIALAQQLPLNPILGETFEGRINGDPLYFEQICHHPPISYYLMLGQNYRLYSPHLPLASLSLTQVEGRQAGHPILELKNRKKIYYMWFPIRVKGLIMGDRVVQAAGRSFCFEPESRIICELNYDQNTSKQQFYSNIQHGYDVISGGIYQVTQKCIDKFLKAHKFSNNNNANSLSINLVTDVEQIISKAEGDYKDFLSFDGIKYWDGSRQRPFIVQMENYALPSDSRYRLDSISMRQGDNQQADKYKDELEIQQRKDKKLRNKFNKKKK